MSGSNENMTRTSLIRWNFEGVLSVRSYVDYGEGHGVGYYTTSSLQRPPSRLKVDMEMNPRRAWQKMADTTF